MKFDPDPPTREQTEKIDRLEKVEFERLVETTRKLTGGGKTPLLYKSGPNGHQTRTYEE